MTLPFPRRASGPVLVALALLAAAPMRAAAQPGAPPADTSDGYDPGSAPAGDAAPVDRRADGARPPGVYRGPAVGPPQDAGPEREGPIPPSALARDLRLRSDQASAWRDYLAATLPTPDDRRREADAVRRLATMTTPQRLEFTAQELQRNASDFARRAEAVRRFYGQLTPDQQRRFDQLTGPPPAGGPGQTSDDDAPG